MAPIGEESAVSRTGVFCGVVAGRVPPRRRLGVIGPALSVLASVGSVVGTSGVPVGFDGEPGPRVGAPRRVLARVLSGVGRVFAGVPDSPSAVPLVFPGMKDQPPLKMKDQPRW